MGKTSTWLLHLGRVAIARHAYAEIGGWRRLWWRLWWRVEPAPAPLKRVVPDLPPADPPPPMHLVIAPQNRPLCGASIRELWTIEPEFATCPECKRESEAALLQWWVNNR